MSSTTTHISTSGGLITAAFIENIRGPGSRQRGVEPSSRFLLRRKRVILYVTRYTCLERFSCHKL
jgi:hypothetical protein